MNQTPRTSLLAFVLLGLVGLAALSSLLFLQWQPPSRPLEEPAPPGPGPDALPGHEGLDEEGAVPASDPGAKRPVIAGTANLEGRVLSIATREGVAGLRVVAAEGPAPFSPISMTEAPYWSTRGSGSLLETTTTGEGRFRLTGLPERPITLYAVGPTSRTPHPLRVAPAAGASLTGLTLLVEPAGALTGRVLTGRGEPVRAALISLGPRFSPLAALSGDWTGVRRAMTYSDNEGDFGFEGVPDRRGYQLTVRAEGFAPATVRDIAIRDSETTSLTTQLLPEATISGRVVDSAGRPVVGARTEAFLTGPLVEAALLRVAGITASVATAPDGTFHLGGLGAGIYRLVVSAPGYLVSRIGLDERHTGTQRQISVHLEEGRSVRGMVVSKNGRPVPGARVAPYRKASILGPSAYLTWRERPAVRTDDEGRFECGGLEAGAVELIVHASGFATRTASVPAGRDNVDISLQRCGAVQGIVIDSRSSTLVQSFEVSLKSDVAPLDVRSFRRELRLRRHRSFHSPGGTFLIEDLAPGSYTVRVEAPGLGRLEQKTIEVAGGQTTRGLKFFMQPEAWITGRVVDAGTKAPLVGARVQISTHAESLVERNLARLLGPPPAVTDTEGRFRLGGFASETVRLRAWCDDHAPHLSYPVPLSTGHGVEDLVLSLAPAATIAGRTFDAAGTPESHAVIYVSDALGRHLAATLSDSRGGFEIHDLGAGTYDVLKLPRDAGLDLDNMLGSITRHITVTTVTLDRGQSRKIEIRPRKGRASLRGRVMDAENPVGGLLLQALGFSRGGSDLGLHSSQTDTNGSFEIDGLSPGKWLIRIVDVDLDSMSGCSGLIYTVMIKDKDETRELEIRLPTAEIKGQAVSRDTGQPLEGITVVLQRDDPKSWDDMRLAVAFCHFGRVRTDSSGAFRFGNLPDGIYAVLGGGVNPLRTGPDVWGQQRLGRIEVRAGRPSEPIRLVLDRAGGIDGRVIDQDGNPLAGASIFMRPLSGDVLEPISELRSDDRGAFHQPALASGDYEFLVKAKGVAFEVAGQAEVRAGEQTEVVLQTRPGRRLTVHVSDSSGRPVADAYVALFTLEADGGQGRLLTRYLAAPEVARILTTRPDGVYELGWFSAGRYRILALGDAGQHTERDITLDPEKDSVVEIVLE